MKQVPTKADDVDVLPAASYNSLQDEAEAAVERSGQTLDGTGEDTADPDPTQLARAMTIASQVANQYRDSGSVNSYVLSAFGNFRQPSTYADGMTVTFKAGNSSTGPSTVNIGSIGSRPITTAAGVALTEGDILADTYVTLRYNLTETRFELASSPGLESVGLQIKDEGAISGSEVVRLNFTGASVSVQTNNAFPDQRDIVVASETVSIQSDGIEIANAATVLNFSSAFTLALQTDGSIDVSADIPARIPAGTVVDFAGTTAPDGWIMCWGTTHNQVDEPDLFAAIGTTYGGDSTTFRVPETRGRVTRGWDNRSSSTAGVVDPDRVFGSLQGDQMPSHRHGVPNHDHGIVPPADPMRRSGGTLNSIPVAFGSRQSGRDLLTGYRTDFSGPGNTNFTGSGNETRMTNIAFNKIIKT